MYKYNRHLPAVVMPIIPQCFAFLSKNATGTWYETHTMKKSKDSPELIYEHAHGMVLLRVEINGKRAFYWLYNSNDAVVFNEYVGLTLKGEAHELLLTSRCRFFYDIDLDLDEFQKHDLADHYEYDLNSQPEIGVMRDIGIKLATAFKDATLFSLQDHEVDESTDLSLFDWMFTMRNRSTADDGFKISIHLITNMMLPLNVCSAIASHVKQEVLVNNIDELGLCHDIIGKLVESIDETQYRHRGSLGLPFGTKKVGDLECTSHFYRKYGIPGQSYLITVGDKDTINNIDYSNYNVVEKSSFIGGDACPEFVKEALQHVGRIKDYNSHVWDINASILRGSTMYVKRYAPSMCSLCDRVHDNDNTLFLIFNSDKGIASWKCVRSRDVKAIVFYDSNQPVDDDDNDIEAFAAKHSSKKTRNKVQRNTTSTVPIKYPIFESKYAADEECDSDDEQDIIASTLKKIPSIKVLGGLTTKTVDNHCEDKSLEYESDDNHMPLTGDGKKYKIGKKGNNRIVDCDSEYESDDGYPSDYEIDSVTAKKSMIKKKQSTNRVETNEENEDEYISD